MFIRISSSESGYDSLYMVEKGKVSRINIKDFDAVIPRIGDNTGYYAFLVEHLNKNLRLFSTNSAEGIRNATNQLKTLQVLSSNGIPTPRTVFAQNPNHIEHIIRRVDGYPAVCKLLYGSGGSGVSLLKDRLTAVPILQSLFKSKSSVLLQEYLPAGGKDYRIIVIGGTVVAAMERTAARSDFRANLKQDGKGKSVMLDEAEKQLCINAARALNLGAVGIDLIKANGRAYGVEANANHGWGVEHITGLNIAEMMIQYCEQNYQVKNIEKSQVLSYQRQLTDERISNDKLTQQVKFLEEQLKVFTGDKYIRSIFKKAKGKKVSYQDRARNKKQIKVETLKDIFIVMKDTFIIK
jgi:ribosomal protein S6--L-glutamate ligase